MSPLFIISSLDFVAISVNVCVLIFSAMLKLAQSFMAHKAPVRIGVVFCGGPETSNSIEEQRSDIIRRVLNYAVADESIKKAYNMLVEVSTTGCHDETVKQ